MSIKILDTNWEICDWTIMLMKKPQIPHNLDPVLVLQGLDQWVHCRYEQHNFFWSGGLLLRNGHYFFGKKILIKNTIHNLNKTWLSHYGFQFYTEWFLAKSPVKNPCLLFESSFDCKKRLRYGLTLFNTTIFNNYDIPTGDKLFIFSCFKGLCGTRPQ